MSFLRFSTTHACLLAFATAAATAQPAVPTTLALAEALELASEHNPVLLAERQGERAAEALVEQAGLTPLPTFEASLENFAGSGSAQGVRGIEATLQASRTFERGGKRSQRITLARRDRETAAADFAVRRTDVLGTTALAFVGVLAAEQRLLLAREPVALARNMLTAVEARVSAGVGSPAESARARATLASAEVEGTRAVADVAAARAALAAIWNGRAADLTTLAGRIRIPDHLPAEADWRAAIARHPQLELQQAIIARQRAALSLVQTQVVPDVTASGGVRFSGEDSDAAFVAAVSIPFPMRNRNEGRLRAARATLAGTEQMLSAVESSLRLAVSAAWRDADTAHRVATALRRDALPASEEAQAVTRQAYDAGELPLLDVLDAQRELAGLRRALFDAEAACIVALVKAEALVDPSFPLTRSLLSSP